MAANNEVEIVVRSKDKTNVSGISQNFTTKLNAGMQKAGESSGKKLQGAFTQALQRQVMNAAAMVPLLGAGILAAAPIIGALAAGGIVAAFGAGLVGLGIVFAAKNKEVQSAFSGTIDHISKTMTKISQPFEGVLLHVNHVFRNTFDAFVPYLESAFKKLEAPMKVFTTQIGAGLKQLAPTIGPITDAFIALTGALGPAIPGIIAGIAEGIIAVANSIKKNPQTFVTLIQFFGNIVEYGLKAVGWLNGTLAPAVSGVLRSINRWFREHKTEIKSVALATVVGLASAGAAYLRFGAGVMTVVAEVISGVGQMSVFVLEAASKILGGMVAAFGWIKGFGDKLREAQGKVNEWKNGVGAAFETAAGKARTAAGGMNRAAGALDNVAGAAGRARSKLDQVHSKTITLSLRDSASATALLIQRRIEQIRGKTVSVNVYYFQRVIGSPPSSGGARSAVAGFAHGGVQGAAAGGARSNWTMVGEGGPELVKLPAGSTVVPNGRTRQMMAGSGGAVVGILELNSSGRPVDDFILEIVRRAVRVRGGNVQLALGRS